MAEQKISKGFKFLLEIGPIFLFFVGYFYFKEETFTFNGVDYAGFIAVTAAFIPICVVSMAILWRLTGQLSKMQVVTTVLVVVFGGMTIWFNDERFFKIKPTIIYLLFALVLGVGLLKKRSFLQFALEEAMPLTQTGWLIMTRHTALFFLLLAIVNELIWRNFSTDVWVTFKTFGLPITTALFFVLDIILLKNHMTETNQSHE